VGEALFVSDACMAMVVRDTNDFEVNLHH
jgi:hypothetical protein